MEVPTHTITPLLQKYGGKSYQVIQKIIYKVVYQLVVRPIQCINVVTFHRNKRSHYIFSEI